MSSPQLSEHSCWCVNPYSWTGAQELAKALGVPLVAAMVLAGRGLLDPAQARRFIEGGG